MKFKAKVRNIGWYRENVPCMDACPVHTDAGKYVQLIAQGHYEEAYLAARSPNPMASICGRICAAPCEDACRRGKIDEPITIRALKRFVCERFGSESWHPDTHKQLFRGDVDPGTGWPWSTPSLSQRKGTDRGRRVAVIGSGPAGLACAHDLAVMGHQVTIFEAANVLGGALRQHIPNHRLPREYIENEINTILGLGVELKLNAPLTADFGIPELKRMGYEAVFLAPGAQQGQDLDIEGGDLDGVIKAIDYLLNINRGYRVDLGEKVIVIGGGAVALDVARTAIRVGTLEAEEAISKTAESGEMVPALDVARVAVRGGARQVRVFSRRSLEEWSVRRSVQGREEFEEAQRERVVFHPSRAPKRILGSAGKVNGMEFVRVERVENERGQVGHELLPGSEEYFEADSVILAVGQTPDLTFLRPEDGVEITTRGFLEIDPDTMATTAPGVYAGGDAAFGPRIVIEAVWHAKRAALSIDDYLLKRSPKTATTITVEETSPTAYTMPSQYDKLDRRKPPHVDIERRTGISEVEMSFSEEEAVRQAARCLVCHVETIYDSKKCIVCGRCVDICPYSCWKLIPIDQLEIDPAEQEAVYRILGYQPDEVFTAMIKDDERCIRCGLCAIRCPTGAISMERLSVSEREYIREEEKGERQ